MSGALGSSPPSHSRTPLSFGFAPDRARFMLSVLFRAIFEGFSLFEEAELAHRLFSIMLHVCYR